MIAAGYGTVSPYAAVVVYAQARGEVWRIGDCPFAIDGIWNIPDFNPHERVFFAFRRMMKRGYGKEGHASINADALSDVVRDWLSMTKCWVNAGDDPFAFGALDERSPPERFLEVFPVPELARSIALASDGAVVSREGQRGPRDVGEMLQRIRALKYEDPSCVELFPYWRGFLERSHYLDDTSLLRLQL